MRLSDCAKLLAQYWPFAGKRAAVLAGYRALGAQFSFTLADIALRNGVFRANDQTDPAAISYWNGRRDCALEIFQLAKADAASLYALIESKPSKETRT